jgi:hypothetical protein
MSMRSDRGGKRAHGGAQGGRAGGGALSAAAPVVASSGLAFVLSADCGPAFGQRGFVCGAGQASVAFACPAVRAVPTCLLWDASAQEWNSTACAAD